SDLLRKSLQEYNANKPEDIPFREEIAATLDPSQATNEFAGNKLKLNMNLNKVLPQWMAETKQKYK
ncbi:restriction endonuclease subunit R, partial [Streptococcus suis]